MKKFIKIIAMGTLISLTGFVISSYWTPVITEARTWPENPAEWTEADWRDFNIWYGSNYGNSYYNSYYNTPVWYNGHYCYFNGSNWYYIGEDGCSYYVDMVYPYQNNYVNIATQPTGYNAYNYGSGILDVYDGTSEAQAQILAKIIYLYGHGVASQTQQACVGWAVMNSIDASSAGVDIGAIAPNFHYDSSKPTTDDYGRDLMPLARDIIFRWKAGRAGITNNGRVMPSGYCWVWSTGTTVLFRNTPNESGAPWNYSYPSPYGS